MSVYTKFISVDFLPFTFKRALKVFIKEHVLRDRRGEVLYGDLTSRCWQVSSKILVYSTIDSVLNKKRIAKEIKRILHEQEMEDNLVFWNYNPLYIDYFSEFPQAQTVFDAVDNWAAHSSYTKFKYKILENYAHIGRESDVVFTVSDQLRDLFGPQAPAHWVPNGVDVDHFVKTKKISERLEGIPRPIIGFLGVLQDRIDVELITQVAQKYRDASVVLVGPIWRGFPQKALEQLGNVYFTGPASYPEIPEFYNGFDVALIPYKQNEFIKSTNSMKFYEYLAAGLPVVSTPCPGAEQFGEIMTVTGNAQEFITAVGNALSQEKTQELVKKRREVLAGKTWADRIETMCGYLK